MWGSGAKSCSRMARCGEHTAIYTSQGKCRCKSLGVNTQRRTYTASTLVGTTRALLVSDSAYSASKCHLFLHTWRSAKPQILRQQNRANCGEPPPGCLLSSGHSTVVSLYFSSLLAFFSSCHLPALRALRTCGSSLLQAKSRSVMLGATKRKMAKIARVGPLAHPFVRARQGALWSVAELEEI